MKAEVFSRLKSEKNVTPENFDISNGYIDNYPAVIMQWSSEAKQLNQVINFEYYQIGCIKNRKNYMITLSIPTTYYSGEFQSWLSSYLNSFRFE